MKIVTHNGQYHPDDVFAVATLLLLYPDAEVIRTRDEEEIKNSDIAVDVGLASDPSNGRFDHHQIEGAGKRDNGIPYASFGLVWKEYGDKLAGVEAAKIIDTRLAQPIDANDNGVLIAEPKFEGVRSYTIGDYLHSFLNQDDVSEENLYKTFIDCVRVASNVLSREIKNSQYQVAVRKVVEGTYAKANDKKLVVFEDKIDWILGADLMADTIYVVYKRKDDSWGVRALTPSKLTYEPKKPFPVEWRAKSSEELAQVTGVVDATFCHKEGFLTVAKSKEGALKLALIALNA